MNDRDEIKNGIKQFLDEEGIRHFSHLLGLKGDVFPCLKLNTKRKGMPLHITNLREGMQVRNYIRTTWNEYEYASIDDLNEICKPLIEELIYEYRNSRG